MRVESKDIGYDGEVVSWALPHRAGRIPGRISVPHQADEMTHEINFMHARRYRFEANPFSGKSPANDPQTAGPANAAINGNPARGPVALIMDITRRRAKKPAALAVKRSGYALVQ